MRVNHGEQHPVLHASEDETRETQKARQRQLDQLDELQAQLGQLPADSPEAKAIQCAAVRVLNQLYEETKTAFCNCRISSWYHRTSSKLNAPLSWEPL